MSEPNPDWFKSWFNQDYADLYSKRDSKEAESQVDFLLSLDELSRFTSELSILDVACGTGRHLAYLLNKTKRAYGVDLSKTLLDLREKTLAGHLVLGDMRRLPLSGSSVNLVTSFFTSFGYFPGVDEELKVLSEFNRILTKNGLIFFDLANKQFVVNSLVPSETLKYANGSAEIKREIKNRNGQTRVEKKISIMKSDGSIVYNREDVHLFDKDELGAILKPSGFNTVRVFGSFNGESYTPNSKRLIVLAEKI